MIFLIFLVTGASGYIGSACAKNLLLKGYDVIATTRKQQSADKITDFWQSQGIDTSKLSWRILDINSSTGWPETMQSVDIVLHIASPVITCPKASLAEVARPAVAGVKNILEATRNTQVTKVVITSSSTAMNARDGTKYFDHNSWSDLASPNIGAYAFSKTYAEMMAWNMKALQADLPEITTILPSVVTGAAVYPGVGSFSVKLIKQIIQGSLPRAMYKTSFHFVTLADIVELHIQAALNPQANSKRFICSTREPISLETVRAWLDEAGYINKSFNWDFSPLPSKYQKYIPTDIIFDCIQAEQILGWQPRPIKAAVLELANY